MTSTFNVIIPISPTVSESITILFTRFTHGCTIKKSESASIVPSKMGYDKLACRTESLIFLTLDFNI